MRGLDGRPEIGAGPCGVLIPLISTVGTGASRRAANSLFVADLLPPRRTARDKLGALRVETARDKLGPPRRCGQPQKC